VNREWVTRSVRAYNVKPGDVVEFYDSKRHKVVRKTVASVTEADDPEVDSVLIRFRQRCRYGLMMKRLSLVRVRRLEGSA